MSILLQLRQMGGSCLSCLSRFFHMACGRLALVVVGVVGLAACSSAPPAPAWKMEAKESLERANEAYLAGDRRVADAEMRRVRAHIAGTGRGDWLAQAELAHCATHVASLELGPCAGFEALRADATTAQRAYADYLQALDAAPLAPATSPTSPALTALTDPLKRLVGAGVLLQRGQASPDVIALAVETASAQGWRRPLLAWLGVQALRAEQAGNTAELNRLRRRIALAEGRARATP